MISFPIDAKNREEFRWQMLADIRKPTRVDVAIS
jgi:hypothetical protein